MLLFLCFFFFYNVFGSLGETIAQGGIITSELTLSSLYENVAPTLSFGSGNTQIQFKASNEEFVIKTVSATLLALKQDNSIEISARELILKNDVNIQGNFLINKIPQWVLFHREDFSSFKAFGWDNKNTDLVTECAGIQMLGGYKKFSKGEISKKISDIPPHFQVRIKANFHFIDSWIGQTAFMRLNIGKDGSMVYTWTDTHNQNTEAYSVNVCGAAIGEGKFSVPIDVAVDHTYDSINVGFGTTIETDDPSDLSWGVSAIEVYIR